MLYRELNTLKKRKAVTSSTKYGNCIVSGKYWHIRLTKSNVLNAQKIQRMRPENEMRKVVKMLQA